MWRPEWLIRGARVEGGPPRRRKIGGLTFGDAVAHAVGARRKAFPESALYDRAASRSLSFLLLRQPFTPP
jgi:hypothetical protein